MSFQISENAAAEEATTGHIRHSPLLEIDRLRPNFETSRRVRQRVAIGSGLRKDWPQGSNGPMPYSFETALILVIEDGEIVEVIDRSARATEWRALIARSKKRSARETIPASISLAELYPYSWAGKEDWF